MSKFNQKLELYIKESGETKARIAKKVGIDRTILSSFLSGNRKLDSEKIYTLIDCLNLTPSEKKELLNLYHIQDIGEEIYERRKNLKRILEVTSLNFDNNTQYAQYSKFVSYGLDDEASELNFSDEAIQTFYGKGKVANLIKLLFGNEMKKVSEPTVCVYAAFNDKFLKNIFLELHTEEYKGLKIKHLMYFIKKFEDIKLNEYNLTILENILPQILEDTISYEPYYYYNNEIVENVNGILQPYYIIFKEAVVMLSADFTSATFVKNDEFVELYKKGFNSRIKEAAKLVSNYNSIDGVLSHMLRRREDESALYHMERQPCFLMQCTKKLISELIREDVEHRKEIHNLVIARYEQLKNNKNKINIFNKKGLDEFVNKGIVYDFPPEYSRALSVEEKIFLLENLLRDCEKDNPKLRVIKSESFKFSTQIFLEVSEINGVAFTVFDNENLKFKYLNIDENTLLDSFLDFVEGMCFSDDVYSKEETMEIIKEAIEKLNAEKDEE